MLFFHVIQGKNNLIDINDEAYGLREQRNPID